MLKTVMNWCLMCLLMSCLMLKYQSFCLFNQGKYISIDIYTARGCFLIRIRGRQMDLLIFKFVLKSTSQNIGVLFLVFFERTRDLSIKTQKKKTKQQMLNW